MKKLVCFILVISLLLSCIMVVTAESMDEFTELTSVADTASVDVNKIWRIDFVEEIQNDVNLKYKIYIKDDLSGFIFPTNLEIDETGKTVYLKHKYPFQSGRRYTIYINRNVKNKNGEIHLKNNYKLKFGTDPSLVITQLTATYGIDEETLLKKKEELKNWVAVEHAFHVLKYKQIRAEQNIGDNVGASIIDNVNGTGATRVIITGLDNNQYYKEGYIWTDILDALFLSSYTGVSVDELMKSKGKERNSVWDGSKFVGSAGEKWDRVFLDLNINMETIIRRLGMPQEHIDYFGEQGLHYNAILDTASRLHFEYYRYWRIQRVSKYLSEYDGILQSELAKYEQIRKDE